MGDLYAGLSIMTGLAAVLGIGTWWVTARASKPLLDALALAVIGGIVAFVFVLRDSFVMARWLPYSNLVLIGNWLPLFAGVLAGLLVRRIQGRVVSQVLWSTLLVVTAFSALFDPFRGAPPFCDDVRHELCRGCYGIGGHSEVLVFHQQTSPVTCSPAAACTLLAEYGIDVDESIMADLALTRRNGTTWHGLFRGLILATADTKWRPEPFETDYDTLAKWLGPKLLFVELKPDGNHDPIYEEEWGWAPGQRHTVVFYQPAPDERVIIGDPSVGVEEWSMRDMRTLWHGQGMRLVPRTAE